MESNASLEQKQSTEEFKIISLPKTCVLSHKYKNSENLKTDVVKKTLGEKFYDVEFMQKVMCIVDVIIYGPETDHGMGVSNEAVQELFRQLKRVASGVYGDVMSTSLGDTPQTFMIKIPKPPSESVHNSPTESNEDMLHEMFIATMCLNDLRKKVPNFAYVFGGFKCIPPKIFKNDTVSALCGLGKKSNYIQHVLYERIVGPTMSKSLKDIGFSTFLSWYLQVLFALQIAYEYCDFTHYDLHDGNVMLRPWPGHDIFQLKYKLGNGATWHVKTNATAVMIDFGTAHARYEGQSFGCYNLEKHGVFPNRARPMYDAYKLLGFCMYEFSKNGNISCFSWCCKIYRILDGTQNELNDMEIAARLKAESKNFHVYSNQYLESEEKYGIQEFLEDIQRELSPAWNRVVSSKPFKDIPIMCLKDTCNYPETDESLIFSGNNQQKVEMTTFKNATRPNNKSTKIANAKLDRTIESLKSEINRDFHLIDLLLSDEALERISADKINDHPTEREFVDIIENIVNPNMELRSKTRMYIRKCQTLKTMTGGSEKTMIWLNYRKWFSNYENVIAKMENLNVDDNLEPMRRELAKSLV